MEYYLAGWKLRKTETKGYENRRIGVTCIQTVICHILLCPTSFCPILTKHYCLIIFYSSNLSPREFSVTLTKKDRLL